MSCEFCERFDFSTAKIEVDKYSAKILLALCDTKFDKDEQFDFCPKCGKKLKRKDNSRLVQMIVDNYDILHNPKVKEKYKTLYDEVYAHDKVCTSSWYNLSEEAYAGWKEYVANDSIDYYR